LDKALKISIEIFKVGVARSRPESSATCKKVSLLKETF
jgi:hypothetical protein